MSYARPLARKCKTCSFRPTHEVINDYSGSMGLFCKGCARLEVKRLDSLRNLAGKKDAARDPRWD